VERGPVFNHSELVLNRLVHGGGAAVGDDIVARRFLEDGRLRVAFPRRLPGRHTYFLLYRSRLVESESFIRFCNWVNEAAAEQRSWFEDFWNANIGRAEH
jgi:LysR family glycine cleavage system transcriptional activator